MVAKNAVRNPVGLLRGISILRDYDIRPVVVHPTKRADFSRHGYRAAQFEDELKRLELPVICIDARHVAAPTTRISCEDYRF